MSQYDAREQNIQNNCRNQTSGILTEGSWNPAECLYTGDSAGFQTCRKLRLTTNRKHDLMDLAAAFHGLWNLGKEELQLRFIQEDDEAGSMARLALIRATALTLRSGFDVIGVTPQDELR